MSAAMSICIPAYNAAATLGDVIRRIPENVWQNVVSCWIINDGSRDGTGRVIYSLGMINKKIRAVHFDKNRGYGAAVKKGLSLCRRESCDVAACLHADGQYPPELLGRFSEAMHAGGYDVLQGSRIASGTARSGGMPLYKYVAGKVLTFFENKVFGLSMTDYHSGYMFYSRAALDTIRFDNHSASFDFDLQMIASAVAAGLNVGELPIPTRYAGEKSYLNPVTYGVRVLGVMAGYIAGRYRSVT